MQTNKQTFERIREKVKNNNECGRITHSDYVYKDKAVLPRGPGKMTLLKAKLFYVLMLYNWSTIFAGLGKQNRVKPLWEWCKTLIACKVYMMLILCIDSSFKTRKIFLRKWVRKINHMYKSWILRHKNIKQTYFLSKLQFHFFLHYLSQAYNIDQQNDLWWLVKAFTAVWQMSIARGGEHKMRRSTKKVSSATFIFYTIRDHHIYVKPYCTTSSKLVCTWYLRIEVMHAFSPWCRKRSTFPLVCYLES